MRSGKEVSTYEWYEYLYFHLTKIRQYIVEQSANAIANMAET